MAKFTEKQIQEMLAGLSPEQLRQAAQERAMESVKADLEDYTRIDIEQTERIARIRAINPDWKVPTQGDRIVTFLTDNPSTKAEIIKGTGIQSGIWLTLKKLQDDKRVTLDAKTEKYSLV